MLISFAIIHELLLFGVGIISLVGLGLFIFLIRLLGFMFWGLIFWVIISFVMLLLVLISLVLISLDPLPLEFISLITTF